MTSRPLPSSTFLQRGLLALLASWMLYNWAVTLSGVVNLYCALPSWDYWRVAANIPAMRARDFSYLWVQHNEHRIIVPDLVFTADALWFHALRIAPLAVSCGLYVGSWLILCAALRDTERFTGFGKAAAALLAGVLIGWRGSTAALGEPFLLQWTAMEFSFLLSVLCVARRGRGGGRWLLCAAVLAGVAATYSSGNGLLVWPVLLLCGWLARCTATDLAALALSGLAADGLYFVHFRFGNELRLELLFTHPVVALEFIGAYLSMPFGGMKSPSFGVGVGLSYLAIATACFFVAKRRRMLQSSLGILLLASFVLTVTTAMLTAAGRLDLTDVTFSAAKAPRYVLPLMINWGAFVMLVVWLVDGKNKARLWGRYALIVALCILLGLSFKKLKWWLDVRLRPYVATQISEVSVQNGVADPRLLHQIFPDPSFVEGRLAVLRNERLSSFYRNPGDWIGRPLADLHLRAGSTGEGGIVRVYPVVSGFEIAGWSAPGVKRVYFADENGRIAGYGRRTGMPLPGELLSQAVVRRRAWIGFVPERFAQARLRVWGESSRLLAQPGKLILPSIRPVSASGTGAEIEPFRWRPRAPWILSGAVPVDERLARPGAPIYGSWHGPEPESGTLESERFAAPRRGCIVVPVLHGTASRRLRVELLDGKTGAVLGSVPMQDDDDVWEFWRLPSPSSATLLQLRATDEGRSEPEWLAISQPLNCK